VKVDQVVLFAEDALTGQRASTLCICKCLNTARDSQRYCVTGGVNH